MDRVKMAVVGTGGIFHGWGGGSGHLPALPQVREGQLIALCDSNPENLERALIATRETYEAKAAEADAAGTPPEAKRLRDDAAQVQGFADFGEMLAEARPDLVSIVTTPRGHAPLTVQALRAGAHVMCEKPMTRTWLEAKAICDAVAETGLMFQHNEDFIYRAPWPDLRKLLAGGAIGEPLVIFLPLALGEAKPVRWDPMTCGGGALLDMGCHAITSAWFALDFEMQPRRVKSVAPHGVGIRMPDRLLGGRFRRVELEDEAHVAVEFEHPTTGAWATLHTEASFSYRDSAGPLLIGTDGTMEFGLGAEPIRITDAFGNTREVQPVKPRDDMTEEPDASYTGMVGEMRCMCRCILDGARPICDERVGAETQAIIGAAYLSEMRGRYAVGLDEFKQWALELQAAHGEDASDEMIRRWVEFLRGAGEKA
jgi:predicted dehydrogenase